MDERRDKAMGQELEIIRKTLFLWLIVFFALAILIFPFSLAIFQKIYSDLVPANIEMLVTNPLNPFFIQIQVALFFAFILSLPVLCFRIIRYLSPALYPKEKKTIFLSAVPAFLLFILGCVFAYFLLVPMTLKIMNSYNETLKMTSYFEIGQFITFALFAILITGLSFLLPVFMKTLSSLGIVNSSFWLANFKYSLIAIVILTAIITPDGTGVTMIILSFPLVSLYFFGYILSKGGESRVRLG